MQEAKIRLIYNLHVKNKFFYRTISNEYYKDVKKKGLNPKNNPYQEMKKDLIQFFKILDFLEKKNFNYVYTYWPNEKPIGSKISRVHRKSLNKKYLDLTLSQKELDYYSNRKGGDIPNTVNHIAEDLINWDYPLTYLQINLIKKVQRWAKKKIKFSMKKIRISATSKFLENADFQRFGQEYIPCPYGSFKHFKKVINKYGWKTYKPFMLEKKHFYVRLKDKIPPEEIDFIK
ncbi:hypothetical protein HN448_01170 [archaeon]|nr:hypothetical protein [archaeon]